MGNIFGKSKSTVADNSIDSKGITEIVEDDKVIGIHVPCTYVKYNLGDTVIVKLENGGLLNVKIKKIVADYRQKKDYFIAPNNLKFYFDSIQEKVENQTGGEGWGIGFIGTTENGPPNFYHDCRPGKYLIGDIVEYTDNYKNKYILKILRIDSIKKKVILGDETGNELDSIPYVNLKEKLNPNAKLKIPDEYRRNSTVKFVKDGKELIGTVRGFTKWESNGQKNIVLTVKLEDGTETTIPSTQQELKVIESDSGNKKYTLEDNNKYRVKYMKYKAKYLAQKI